MGSHPVCVIGAGSSGLVASKVLHERGIPFVCFEKGSGIGGNWRFDNDNGMSAAYRSLHINTSRTRMAYSDFPMPESYPDYASHDQVLAYFEDYANHFGFRDTIRFGTEVRAVEPAGDGSWWVTSRTAKDGDESRERFSAVLVANGHHWAARTPGFPGSFDGETLHAHDFRVPEPFAGKRVLILGVGNSGVDLAADLVPHAATVTLASRRGAHVLPKTVFGRPLDTLQSPLSAYIPFGVQRRVISLLTRVSKGRQDPFPKPDYPLGAEHPTVSDVLPGLVRSGRVTTKPTIERLDGDGVVFADGTRETVDTIIWATGYDVRFPFLGDDLVPVRDNRVDLYRFVVPPEVPNLYFIGLLQPLGAIMPLAEVQSEWVADLLEGNAALPAPAEMHAAIQDVQARMARRYTTSPRHTLQVDLWKYMRDIRKERKQARRRKKNT